MIIIKKYKVIFSLILSLIITFAVFQSTQMIVSASGGEKAGAKAAEWAMRKANDNSWNYGPKGDGCYLCGTRGGKYYCCNSFVIAAYTHGAKVFKKCGGTKLNYSYWPTRGFKELRKNPKESQLIPGDLLLRSYIKPDGERKTPHVMIYIGFGKIAQARSPGYDAGSINIVKYSDVMHHEQLVQFRYKTSTKEGCKDYLATHHNYPSWSVGTKATLSKNGKLVRKCVVEGCGKKDTSAIAHPKTFKLSTTSYNYDGKVKTPSVKITDSKGSTISSKYYKVTYSNNTAVGTGKATVKFSGVYSGSKTLTFKIVKKKTKPAPKPVTENIPPTGVSLSKSKAFMVSGQTLNLIATVLPSNASNKTVTWTSSNSSVASVSAGQIIAKSSGMCTITAKTVNGKTASCTVTIV